MLQISLGSMDTKLSVYICLLGIMQMDTHFNGLRLPAIFQYGEVDLFLHYLLTLPDSGS